MKHEWREYTAVGRWYLNEVDRLTAPPTMAEIEVAGVEAAEMARTVIEAFLKMRGKND